jgi:hypothetical protein
MVRGNHESVNLNRMYGFKNEITENMVKMKESMNALLNSLDPYL